ncbi:MAG: T9SS type A sorting domain-containing protein [Bacteroidetes bacterium]|nr:T9SS type A sorting domain-containing protein [Bacteroidota bacterium]
MKTKFTLLVVLVATFFGVRAQQLPNFTFENWTDSTAPDGWSTFDKLYNPMFQTVLGLASKDATVRVPQLGNYSLRLKTDSVFVQGQFYRVMPGIAAVGNAAVVGQLPTFYGLPFNHRPDTLLLAYRYVTPSGIDTATLTIGFRSGGSYLFQGSLILDTTSQFAFVTVPLGQAVYGATAVPDTLMLQFASSNRAPKDGSQLNIDFVGFVYASATGIVTTTDPTTFCEGESATLTAAITNGNPAVTYQWLKDGAPIANANALTYTATEAGSYAIEVSNGDAVDTSSALALITQTCTGIEAVNAATVSVFPNPVATTLNVTATENLVGLELNLVDVNGRTVLTQALNGTANAISVGDLAKGTYIYTIGNAANGVLVRNTIQIQK